MVRDLRRARENDDRFPDVLFVHRGTPETAEEFFAERWPGAQAIADADGALAEAFSVRRGTIGEIAGPAVWGRGLLALLSGNGIGRPVGDVWLLPGLFLIVDGRIAWSHPFRNSADHPDFEALPDRFEALGLHPCGS